MYDLLVARRIFGIGIGLTLYFAVLWAMGKQLHYQLYRNAWRAWRDENPTEQAALRNRLLAEEGI